MAVNNHTSVWGSFYDRRSGRWGYKCCHATVRNSYCMGADGLRDNDRSNEQFGEHPALPTPWHRHTHGDDRVLVVHQAWLTRAHCRLRTGSHEHVPSHELGGRGTRWRRRRGGGHQEQAELQDRLALRSLRYVDSQGPGELHFHADKLIKAMNSQSLWWDSILRETRWPSKQLLITSGYPLVHVRRRESGSDRFG